jgi:hypothetical protein
MTFDVEENVDATSVIDAFTNRLVVMNPVDLWERQRAAKGAISPSTLWKSEEVSKYYLFVDKRRSTVM